jgi:uncharacterized protein (TIGR03790 family)
MMAVVGALAHGQGITPRHVLIVHNVQQPEGKALADHYAQRRGIPTNQICAIDCRKVETITRQEFREQVRGPILKFLTDHRFLKQSATTVTDPQWGSVPGLETIRNDISCIVLMYGVPLRIDSDPSLTEPVTSSNMPAQFQRDEASVESELALLPSHVQTLRGPLRNPFFDNAGKEFSADMARRMVLVGRLDGPDPKEVRRMIDDALFAEKYGLQGRAYFDARGTQAKGYQIGDDWIRNSDRLFREAGYECEFDSQEELFGDEYPMTDAAIYAGWYSNGVVGPFRRQDFMFRPGALAYHIHSSSGSSVRTRQAFWVGPLLAKGAAVSMGNVYEPYLSMTPHVDMFFKRMLAGSTFIEAGYFSQPALSWQTTFVGDPLYRPFAATVDEQIQRLETDKRPELEWAYLRKINLLMSSSQTAEAERLCRAKAEQLGSVVLEEKLGDVFYVTHRFAAAADQYQKLMKDSSDRYRFIRVAGKLAIAYMGTRQHHEALAVYEGLASTASTNKSKIYFLQKARNVASIAGDEKKAQALLESIQKLAEPPPPPKK